MYTMNYPVADLSEDMRDRIKQLEQELDVVLIAYHKQAEGSVNNEQMAYIDDPNINMI
jgi:ABC-type sugar transport system ATPase subunit